MVQWDSIQKVGSKVGIFSRVEINHDNDFYVEHFNAEVLDQLTALRVVTELQGLLPDQIKIQMEAPFYASPDWHIALVCYEKPADFCHRHIVAKWLCGNGFECHEWMKG